VNGKIYVIGGKVNANCSYPGCINPTGLTVNEEYNPTTDTWANKVAMPTGRRCLDVTAVNGKIYAMVAGMALMTLAATKNTIQQPIAGQLKLPCNRNELHGGRCSERQNIYHRRKRHYRPEF